MNNSRESKRNETVRTYDLYIGHVPRSIQEAALLEVFSKYGTVVEVLIRHSSGSYGYAIVKYKQKKDADKVLRQIDKIYVDNHEMEVRNGRRSSQSAEYCNGSSTMPKTVTFAEQCPSIHHLGNIRLTEAPVSVKDFIYPDIYPVYPTCENLSKDIYPVYPTCESFGKDNYPVYPACENASIPVTVEIMCTHVEDAVTFHGCCLTSFEELQHLSIKLNSICPNLMRILRKPIINKVYGAVYSADCQWYRCKVLQYGASANPSSCIVEYIDYGNIAEVCYTNMVELPEPLKNLSPFAIKCVFSNIIPTAKSLNCVSYLHHLVNHRMSLCALHTWGSFEYLVTKCSCNGIDVIAELVRNGYAMYKTQESSKSTSPKMNKSSKVKESKKSKKDNHKSKKAANSCNGTSKHSHEVKNGGNTIQEKSDRSSSSVESHDFIPKKIIKRGSATLVDSPVLETKTVNHFLKVDSVICNVKVINNIRSLIPLHSYDDLINEAVDLLRSEVNIIVSSDSKQLVENARKAYCEALGEIKECSDMNLLGELKEKRNQQRIELCHQLEKFLKSFDSALLEKRKRIQETITALESNSTAWLNVYLSKIPDTIEDLLVAFNEEKEKKRKKIEMARKNTEEKRAKFLKVYADLGKEFSLNIVNGTTDDTYFMNSVGKKGSWALKFDEALTEFGIALEEERKISTVIEDRSFVSVIQYILEKLDVPKDQIDAECDIFEEYKSLYDDLMSSLDLNPVFDELRAVSKIINSFISSPNNADSVEFSNGHLKLHSALLREDALLGAIVKASAQHFPELIIEHPELRLEEYQKYFCLLKLNWDVHFFPFLEKCNRVEPSYVSSLGDESVIIKEFNINCGSEKAFIKKVKIWNEIKSTILVKIKGLFKSKHNSSRCHETSCSIVNNSVTGNISHEIQEEIQGKIICDTNHNTVTNVGDKSRSTVEANSPWNDCSTECMTHDELMLTRDVIYVVLSPAWETLYDKPFPAPVDYKMALNVLQQVLEGLFDIHSRGIIHSAIHPMSVLHKNGKVLLDFSYDKQLLNNKLCLNGINFQVPKEDLFKYADMYGFGCLVLWVLFPNLSFQPTEEGVPNISAFQSIIENMLLPKDFASLSALLDVNCNIRPTSRMLRSNGFLKDLHVMSESSSS